MGRQQKSRGGNKDEGDTRKQSTTEPTHLRKIYCRAPKKEGIQKDVSMLQCLRKSPFEGGSKLRWKLVAPKLTANDRPRRHQPLQARLLDQTSNITRRLERLQSTSATNSNGESVSRPWILVYLTIGVTCDLELEAGIRKGKIYRIRQSPAFKTTQESRGPAIVAISPATLPAAPAPFRRNHCHYQTFFLRLLPGSAFLLNLESLSRPLTLPRGYP